MEDKFRRLLKAYTPDEVIQILDEIGEPNIRFEPVGGRRNNLATINIGSDPAAGVTERITNAIDAVLEKEWTYRNQPDDYPSPRRAVESWFGIEEGKISKIREVHDSRLKALSQLINVCLYDSGHDARPTVEVRDKGLGLCPEDFSRTILDLNSSNKIEKLHLMGAYGQGGSTALSYNNLTIIMSKPFFGNEVTRGKVAWTIVRINRGNVNRDKHEWYEYMVDAVTGQPFFSEIPDDEFEPGTLVRHIMMDLGKYRGPITTPQRSLWYLSNNYLFDPIIPFTISDRRNGKNDNRTVTGNNRLLTNTENREYDQEVPLRFRDGKVVIYYWVLNTSGDNAKERIAQYVEPSHPILITFNGQKQGNLSNSLIKNQLKLPFLDRYLIVQIEADNLDNDSKRQLFSSTRESLRDTSILEELKQVTIDTLKEDPELTRLDRERKERYFKHDNSAARDNLRRRLAQRINSFLREAGSGSAVVATPVSDSASYAKRPPIPVEEPPTFFEIVTKSPKKICAGKAFSIRFRTNANPNYFDRQEHFVAFIEPHELGTFSGSARVVDGYGLAFFRANETLQVGETGRIVLELRPPNHRSMTSSIELIVCEETKSTDPSSKGSAKTPNIRVEFVYRNEEFFKESGWDENSVAKVTEGQEEVIIFVSAENKNLNKVLARAQRKDDFAVDSIKNKYLEHISFHAFILNRNKPEDFCIDSETSPMSDEMFEKIKEQELRNASETVCGMIQDLFEAIVIESGESQTATV